MRAALILAVAVAIASPSPRARADDDATKAKRLFDEGRALVEQGKALEACVLFEKSYELEPAVGTRLNLAECAERDRKLARAYQLYQSAAEEYARTDRERQAKFARDRATALVPKIAIVVVRIPRPDAATVRIDGTQLAAARELTVPVDAGTVAVAIRWPDAPAFATQLDVAAGERVELDVPAATPATAEARASDPPARGRTWRTVAIVSGAVTLASAATTLYAWNHLAKTGRNDDGFLSFGRDCVGPPGEPPECASAETYATLANLGYVGFLAGGTVTGIALYKWLANRDERPSRSALVPVLGRDGGGAAWHLTW